MTLADGYSVARFFWERLAPPTAVSALERIKYFWSASGGMCGH
jgi:hypothetical protein